MMTQLDPKSIAARLTEYYGLPVLAEQGRDEAGREYIDLHPEGVPRYESFSVRITLGWRSLHAEFAAGAYAAPMISEMGRASLGDRNVFASLATRTAEEQGVVRMQVNGSNVDPQEPKTWPASWERMSLTLDKSPLEINTEEIKVTDDAIMHWGGRFVAGILALAPLEELETVENVNPEGLPEGASTRVEVNRYERNRFNRAASIEIHGNSCVVCSFNFGRNYGELGDGYIHVHHITPVSELGPDYKIDPVKELVPLCPNCHAMVHRTNPPVSVAELKSRIEENK